MRNSEKKVRLWWIKRNIPTKPLCPNLNIFRLLKLNKFEFKKNKNVLDIGFGNGENLLEFKKRGLSIFGLDIRDKLINYFVKKNNLKKNNFFLVDLNKSLPLIKKKFNLILMIDVLSYINHRKQKKIFNWINDHLINNGFFLFSYTQNDLILKKNKGIDDWEISKKFYKLKKINFFNKNPMQFIKFDQIIDLFKNTNLKFLSSHFDISTYSKKDSSKIRIGRFILMKKK